jgi:hypothetical protein
MFRDGDFNRQTKSTKAAALAGAFGASWLNRQILGGERI